MDELWSGSENRIFVTPSVSRNARFRLFRGEKKIYFLRISAHKCVICARGRVDLAYKRVFLAGMRVIYAQVRVIY